MSKRSLVFMFSGQGSQYYQMGRTFYDNNAKFRSVLLRLNNVATPLLGRSIIDVLYDDRRQKDEAFNDIKLTSVAIFIVEYALARTLIDDGFNPDILLASSMGTYAAAATAGALDPEAIIECLVKLATIYETRCRKGGMIAVLGSRNLHRDVPVLHDHADLAAANFDAHFVISTSEEYLDEISAVLLNEDVTFQRVAVSYPFHSRWIDNVKEAALEVLGTLHYRRPSVPIVCCARTAALDAVTPECIWNTVRKPIEFERTIVELERRGSHDYVDVGPAGTLVTFLKYALPPTSASRKYPLLSPFGRELENYKKLAFELGPPKDASPVARLHSLHG